MNYEKLNSHKEYSTFSLDSVEAYLSELEAIQSGELVKDLNGNYVKLAGIPEPSIAVHLPQPVSIPMEIVPLSGINLDTIPSSNDESESEQPKIQCIFCRNAGKQDIYNTREELVAHLATCVYHPNRAVIGGTGQLICGLCKVNFGQHKHNYDLHVQKCKQIQQKRTEVNDLKKKKELERSEQLVFKYIYEMKKLRASIPENINKSMVLNILEEVTLLFKLLPEGILLAYIKDIYNLK